MRRRFCFKNCVIGQSLPRIELDHEGWFHLDRIGNFGQAWDAGEFCGHLLVVDFHVIRRLALGQLIGFEHDGELLGGVLDLDHVTDLDLIG